MDELVPKPRSAVTPERFVISFPVKPSHTRIGKLDRYVRGALLGPVYWVAGAALGVPGMSFRAVCGRLAIRLLARRGRRMAPEAFRLLIAPLESTRHFEVQFVWEALAGRPVSRYLDLSSPRYLPLAVVATHPEMQAEVVNPDARDLDETSSVAEGLGISGNCRFHTARADELTFPPGSFDVVTSISVLEHVPDDTAAVQRLWQLVRPGGVLLVTVPCAARPREERVDRDPFSVLPPDEDGSYFFQWVYDEQRLEEHVYAVTGPPARMALWGEKEAGALKRRLVRRWGEARYPVWREPVAMWREFRRFDRVSELPGEGVVGLEFVRPLA